MSKLTQEDLEPADVHQCQAQYRPGSFMTLGPRNPLRQCEEVPNWIATEANPGEDGLIGSMSLCDEHLKEARRRLGEDYFTLIPIKHSGIANAP